MLPDFPGRSKEIAPNGSAAAAHHETGLLPATGLFVRRLRGGDWAGAGPVWYYALVRAPTERNGAPIRQGMLVEWLIAPIKK
jgi:hypothetical protein